jgi:hypothetical protein
VLVVRGPEIGKDPVIADSIAELGDLHLDGGDGFSMEWGMCEDDAQLVTCETSLEMRSTLPHRFIPATSNPLRCSFVARWSL